jgi:hypothetical protein
MYNNHTLVLEPAVPHGDKMFKVEVAKAANGHASKLTIIAKTCRLGSRKISLSWCIVEAPTITATRDLPPYPIPHDSQRLNHISLGETDLLMLHIETSQPAHGGTARPDWLHCVRHCR